MLIYSLTIFVLGLIAIYSIVQLHKAHTKRILKLISTQNKQIRDLTNGGQKLSDLIKDIVSTIEKVRECHKKDFEKSKAAIDFISKTQGEMTEGLAQFVHDTLTSLRDLHCDIYEDCEDCPFSDLCDQISDVEHAKDSIENCISEDNNDEKFDSSVAQLPPPDELIEIDPTNKDDIVKLIMTLEKQGLPKPAIEGYLSYLEKIPKQKGQKIKIGLSKVVDTENSPFKNEMKRIMKEVEEKYKPADKLIDPNSKIVKTLNKLYNSSKE